ncbi:SWEET sugar transporter [Phytophthora cactorum]|nr:SWEET sugar transporter [Phytophthora cactorum]
MSSSVESVFRVVAACTSLMMILSPTPAVYKIYKTKSIGNTNIVSLVSVFANCHVWTLQGLLTNNWFPVFSTFVSGDFISIIYMVVFLRYTPDRKHAWKLSPSTRLCLGVFTSLSRGQVNDIMGYLAVCVTLVLYSSPFLKIKDVVKYKTGVFIPIHMVMAGSFNNAMWITYTPMSELWFLFVTNLTVYMIYHPSKHPLGYGATLEDFLEKEKEDDGTLSIAIDRPSVQSASKAIPQSPEYQMIKSPLAPLYSIQVLMNTPPVVRRFASSTDSRINALPRVASLTSISVTLSMIPSVYHIYRKKDTGIASDHHWSYYPGSYNDLAILGNAGYTNQSNDGVDTTLGILGVMAGLISGVIPIPMVAAGALNNVMWIVYCPMIGSWFLFGGNALCLLLSIVNIALYIVYNPKTHPLRLEEGDPEAVEGNLTRVEPASLSMVLSPLPSDDDVGLKNKKNLHSPVYNLVRSPIAGIPSDVSSRV